MASLKLKGSTRTKPAPKGTAAKPARKTSTKKIAAPKRAPRKAAAEQEEKIDRRTARGKVDPAVYARYEDALIAVGERMAAAQAERDAALEEAVEVTQSALADLMPMALVHELTGISRQWLYNMPKHRNRGGSVTEGRLGPRGNGAAPKRPAARKGTARKASTTTARKPASKKLSIKSK